MSNLKYKVGDKVLIKDIGWYNDNKTILGNVECGDALMTFEKARFCGKIVTISSISDVTDTYGIKEDNGFYNWTDEMIDGCVESIEDRMKELRKMCTINLNDSNYSDKVKVLLNDYEYIEENGKSYFVKKKKKYPKTYEECCKVLGVNPDNFLSIRNLYRDDGDEESTGYERDLLGKFDSLWELRICRDAYWKIAGEEMGLGKPWEPDYMDLEQTKFCIIISRNKAEKWETAVENYVLSFPTKEMRDVFYDNFKEEIEICKELL